MLYCNYGNKITKGGTREKDRSSTETTFGY